MPLAPEDRVEILAVLAFDPEEGIAQRAASALLYIPPEQFVAALARTDAAPVLFNYCAQNAADKPGIADAMTKNPGCPTAALASVARYFSSTGIQALLDDLERLTAAPALISALTEAPGANSEQRTLLEELLKGAAPEKEWEEALPAAEIEPEKRKTLLQRLAKMNVLERVKLALTGGREERIALIRDPNKVVQRSVLQSPRLTDVEVESFAAMTVLSMEILRIIANNRLWMKNYTIVRNLIFNSKTPLDITMHQVPRLTPRDLKILSTSKSVPETLRSMAAKMVIKHTSRTE